MFDYKKFCIILKFSSKKKLLAAHFYRLQSSFYIKLKKEHYY